MAQVLSYLFEEKAPNPSTLERGGGGGFPVRFFMLMPFSGLEPYAIAGGLMAPISPGSEESR